MANQIPEKLINYRVYDEGNVLQGIADVTLPDLEAMSDTVSGAGIAGEVDSPVLGHFQSMSATIKWRTVGKSLMKLTRQKSHQLDFRGSQQIYDAGAGEYKTVPVRVSIKGTPKKTGLGSFQVGKPTDSENEFEISYIKIYVEGNELLEIDKYNFICKIDGEDFLASVRADIGF